MLYFIIVLSIYLILVYHIFFTQKNILSFSHTPFVSILLPVRNEAENISSCLDSLLAIHYTNFEILVGNDDSEDNTLEILQSYASQNSKIKLVNIHKSKLKGKVNVLNQLVKKASGNYFLFTDADIKVNPKWIQAMLSQFEEKTGLVTGFTFLKSETLFGTWQSLDWVFTQGVMKQFFEFDKPLTAMGNNMAVSRKAFEETGGYEHIEYSITEDYALFLAIRKLEYECKQVISQDVKAWSLPILNIKDYLFQRKRWLKGAFAKMPFYVMMLLVIQLAFLPTVIIYSFYNFEKALMVYSLKWFLQSLYLIKLHGIVKEKPDFMSLITFDIYFFISSIAQIIFFLLPISVKWKGRIYS